MYGIPGLGFAKPGEKLPPLHPLIPQPTEPAIPKSGGGLERAPEVKITPEKQEGEQAERHDDVIMAELAEEELGLMLGGAAAEETSVPLVGPTHDAAATSIPHEAVGQDITMDDITQREPCQVHAVEGGVSRHAPCVGMEEIGSEEEPAQGAAAASQGIPPEEAARDARDADDVTQDAAAETTPLLEPTPDSATQDTSSEEPRLGEGGELRGPVDVDATLEARLEVIPCELSQSHVPREDTTAAAAAAAAEVPGNNDGLAAPEATDAPDAPEWEIDSSPYRSPEPSESDSSSDRGSDSSDDSDANAEGVGPASLAEMARRLIEMEDGSDDDYGDDPDSRRAAAQALRTKNEMDETVPARPDVAIAPEAPLSDLGVIHHIVESTVVVSALGSGEHRALDVGSVVCTADRVVVGAIADLLGQVRQPFYTIRFSSAEEVAELGLKVGTALSYPVEHARYVFTEPLRRIKGSDASNVHDEEVGDHEVEFSDDEKEREHRRAMREKKRGGGSGGGNHDGGNSGSNGPRRRGGRQGPHPLRNEVRPESTTPTLHQGLPYDDGGDDDADDGPYRPLKRPADYGMAAFVNAQQQQQQARGPAFPSLSSDSPQGRGRNRQRGSGGRNHRGGSGQGRGNSSAGGGRGPGGYHHDRNGGRSTDYVAEEQHQQHQYQQNQYQQHQYQQNQHQQQEQQQPAPRQDQFQYSNQQQLQQPQVQPQVQPQPQPVLLTAYGAGFVAPATQFNYSMAPPMPYPPISTPLQFGMPVPSPAHNPAATPHLPLPAPSPAGFVNPMFFNSLMEQLRQQQGQQGPRPGQ